MRHGVLIVVMVLCGMFMAHSVYAQTQVRMNDGKFTWTWTDDLTSDSATLLAIRCGTTSGGPYTSFSQEHDIALGEIAVGTLINVEGTYFCKSWPKNSFGEGLGSNELHVQVVAGLPPSGTLVLDVIP